MGEILIKSMRPAEFVESVQYDTAGKEVSRETTQVAPEVFHVVEYPEKKSGMIWLLLGGGILVYLLVKD